MPYILMRLDTLVICVVAAAVFAAIIGALIKAIQTNDEKDSF